MLSKREILLTQTFLKMGITNFGTLTKPLILLLLSSSTLFSTLKNIFYEAPLQHSRAE